MNNKVLFVDDDDNMRQSFHRNFRDSYRLDLASGGAQALRAMEEHGPFAVVVADLAMPGMNGIDFLKQAQVLAPDTVRIMFTGHPGPIALMEAINSGQVFRFISKPCQPEDMTRVLDAGLAQYRMITAERELLEATLTGGIEAMTGMLEALAPATFSQARTLAELTTRVARAMGSPDAWALRLAAMYSPLWLLPLPDKDRTRPLAELQESPVTAPLLAASLAKAADLVQAIPRLDQVALIIRHLGSAGPDLPEGSRILRVLVAFTAIQTRVKARDVAMEELRLHGDHDPRILAALAQALDLSGDR